ncbi:MAG: VTT domain-containing protein [bacterium]
MRSIVGTLVAWGPLGVFVLAILDSAGIPLPLGVDLLVAALGTAGIRVAMLGATLALIGSIIGNLILFSIARRGGTAYLRKHTLSGWPARFHRWFLRYGLLTVFIPAALPLPLPLKVFVISAGALGVTRRAFLLVIVAARAARYYGLAYLGVMVGENSAAWLAQHAWHFAAGAVALFVILYAVIKWQDRGHPKELVL